MSDIPHRMIGRLLGELLAEGVDPQLIARAVDSACAMQPGDRMARTPLGDADVFLFTGALETAYWTRWKG